MKKTLIRIICEILGAILGIAVALLISALGTVSPEQELTVIVGLSSILLVIGAIVGYFVGNKITSNF